MTISSHGPLIESGQVLTSVLRDPEPGTAIESQYRVDNPIQLTRSGALGPAELPNFLEEACLFTQKALSGQVHFVLYLGDHHSSPVAESGRAGVLSFVLGHC